VEEKQTIFQKLMGVINKIGSAIMLNLLFLVSCLGIVTIGAAAGGLYSAVRFSIRGDNSFQGFREGFKKHFWRTTAATAICLAAGAFALINAIMCVDALISQPELLSVGSVIQTGVHVLFFGAVLMLSTALIPVNVYFENDANGWLMDGWYLVGHGFFPVLITAILLWLPVVVLVCFPLAGFMLLLIFLAVYYSVVGVIATALLKNTLIQILYRHKSQEETP